MRSDETDLAPLVVSLSSLITNHTFEHCHLDVEVTVKNDEIGIFADGQEFHIPVVPPNPLAEPTGVDPGKKEEPPVEKVGAGARRRFSGGPLAVGLSRVSHQPRSFEGTAAGCH